MKLTALEFFSIMFLRIFRYEQKKLLEELSAKMKQKKLNFEQDDGVQNELTKQSSNQSLTNGMSFVANSVSSDNSEKS